MKFVKSERCRNCEHHGRETPKGLLFLWPERDGNWGRLCESCLQHFRRSWRLSVAANARFDRIRRERETELNGRLRDIMGAKSLKARDLVAALRVLGCEPARTHGNRHVWKTPSGRMLQSFDGSHLNSEVHVGAIGGIKKTLDAEGLDLWAALDGSFRPSAPPSKTKLGKIHCEHRKVFLDADGKSWRCSACAQPVPPPSETNPGVLHLVPDVISTGKKPAPLPTATERLQASTERVTAAASVAGSESNAHPIAPSGPDAAPIQRPRDAMWSKHSPEKKLAAVRELVALRKKLRDGALPKGDFSRVSSELSIRYGAVYTEISRWVQKVVAGGFDVDLDIPDKAARVFDSRKGEAMKKMSQTKRRRRAQRERRERAERAKAEPLVTGPKMEPEAAEQPEAKTDPLPVPKRALLAAIEGAMKDGNIEVLDELLKGSGLWLADIKRLRAEVAEEVAEEAVRESMVEEIARDPRAAAERIEVLERKVSKLIEQLGGLDE